MVKNYIFKIALIIAISCIYTLGSAQGIPEILFYKFNDSGSTTLKNLASSPPKGTKTATINGGLKQLPGGACQGGLIGSGNTSSTDYVETYWKDSLVGTSWTISFWTKGLDSSTNLFYMFNDATATNFRCFTGGVAGAGNMLLRGPLADVLLTGGGTVLPSVATFVYDANAGYVYAYKNGSRINSVAQTTPINVVSTASFIVCGLSGSTTYAGLNSKGVMDEFRFYNRALSASEVAQLSYSPTTFSTTKICGVSSYKSPSGKYTWTKPGIYYDTIMGQGYCDSAKSIGKFIFTGANHTTATINAKACDFYLSPSKNVYWTKTGTYKETIPNKAGCDSVITVNLTINNTSTATLNIKKCSAYTSPSGKYVWDVSGKYIDTIANKKGCDSILTINLTIGKANSQTISVKACDQYKSPSGKRIWINSGTYKDTLINNTGCDSILTIILSLGSATYSSISPKVCNFYKSPSGKTDWTISGKYMDTIRNKIGCDSIITVNLTFNKNTYAQLYPTSCGKYTSPSGKYSTTVTTSFYDTIPNKLGCDSIMLIEVKIIPKTQRTITQTVCNEFISPSKKYIWKISGKYFDTIPNRKGCDSIITFNLTVNVVNVAVSQNNAKLTALVPGANYQWLNCNSNYSKISGATDQTYTATALGKYAVEINNGTCTDTSACYEVTSLSVNKYLLNQYLSITPNPSLGIFYLHSLKTFQNAIIKISNAMGEIVFIKHGHYGNNLEINLTKEASGIYFIEITENELIGNLKLIKH